MSSLLVDACFFVPGAAGPTFREVFPFARACACPGTDVVLPGSLAPFPDDFERQERAMSVPAVARDLALFAGAGPFCSDHWPILEHAAPRALFTRQRTPLPDRETRAHAPDSLLRRYVDQLAPGPAALRDLAAQDAMPEVAIQLRRDALRADPADVAARAKLADHRARASQREADALAPKDAAVRATLAGILYDRGDRLGGDLPNVRLAIASCRLRKRNIQGARAAFFRGRGASGRRAGGRARARAPADRGARVQGGGSMSTVRVRVCGLALRDGAFLAVQHEKDGRRYYMLPGGGLDVGEHLRPCLERELAEELGVRARAGDLLLTCDTIAPDASRHILHLVLAMQVTGEPRATGEDARVVGAAWLTRADLDRVVFYPEITDWLKAALERAPTAVPVLSPAWK